MSIKISFDADAQFAETSKPRVSALDNPAMTTEHFAALDITSADGESWPRFANI